MSAPNKNVLVNLAGLAVILLAVVFCTWPGMHSPLFTDDIHQLDRSKAIDHWTGVFAPDVFGYYRPVKNALFMIAAPLKDNIVAWHWLGLAAYLGATAGVFRIASICFGGGRMALLATCFWALSPSCVSTVVWLSCANISVGIIFAACVFHFHERLAVKSSLWTLLASMVFYALSLLCYESLIAIPGLLFIRDLQQRRISVNRQTLIRFGAYSLVAVAFLLIRHEVSARVVGADRLGAGWDPDTKAIHVVLSAPWFLWRHFLMWIFPFGTIELLGNYSWLRSASAVSLVSAGFFLLALLATAAMTWKRLPLIAFGLLFFFVASIPSGNFIPCFNGPIYDAYVTIPSIGLAIAFATVCDLLIRQFKMRRKESGSLAFAVVLCLLLVYRMPVCGAYFRYWAGVWGNPLELMLLTAETRPLQSQVKGLVTTLLFRSGYIDEAEIQANEVILEVPWDPTAKITLARIARSRGDLPTSEKYYREILQSPQSSKFLKHPAMFELAEILTGNPVHRKEVAWLLNDFLKSNNTSRHAEAIALLSLTYRDQGDMPKARAILERGVALHPEHSGLVKILESIDQPVSEQKAN
ncbi:MAG: hypothetical protein V4819_12105 [Verrucomicrobiota bacterium]